MPGDSANARDFITRRHAEPGREGFPLGSLHPQVGALGAPPGGAHPEAPRRGRQGPVRFYQVHLRNDLKGSFGFRWFTTRTEAVAVCKEHHASDPLDITGIEVVQIQPTRAGILEALRAYASHPDNG